MKLCHGLAGFDGSDKIIFSGKSSSITNRRQVPKRGKAVTFVLSARGNPVCVCVSYGPKYVVGERLGVHPGGLFTSIRHLQLIDDGLYSRS